MTAYRGPDIAPVWNPKSGAQLAWVGGRTGLPQIYLMDADGTNVERLTNEGYAVSPSWSPNGQFLAFAWIRHYGPGAPGAQDIYVMDIASRQWVQLTHDGGRNDSPPGRPTAVISFSSPLGREASKSGACWRMARKRIGSPRRETTASQTGLLSSISGPVV